ncbi:hypothetical protein DPEC_G00152620 [Dallia pectoralis]|uniref:Uncharacterized protein n=1 Tax=Dallia pectoralis TaxID=75939 RepID=A0ACC2GJI9_DALPE|nr:hypothetical protein DPEC_G00152620 [Dallia pectoralis]
MHSRGGAGRSSGRGVEEGEGSGLGAVGRPQSREGSRSTCTLQCKKGSMSHPSTGSTGVTGLGTSTGSFGLSIGAVALVCRAAGKGRDIASSTWSHCSWGSSQSFHEWADRSTSISSRCS